MLWVGVNPCETKDSYKNIPIQSVEGSGDEMEEEMEKKAEEETQNWKIWASSDINCQK